MKRMKNFGVVSVLNKIESGEIEMWKKMSESEIFCSVVAFSGSSFLVSTVCFWIKCLNGLH